MPFATATEAQEAGEQTSRLFRAHQQPVLRYLRSCGLVPQDCDDVVQETFTSLYLHLRAGKPQHNLPGWIFRVAHNLGLKLKLKARQKDVGNADAAPDPRPDAEQSLIHRQRAARVRAVVEALTEQERQCLMLRAEGLRYREIAAALGVSLGMVSLLTTRALDKLRRAQETLER